MPYNLNFVSDMKQPVADINLAGTSAEYHINGSFEASRLQYQNNQNANQAWGHVLGPHSFSIYDERSFPQVDFTSPDKSCRVIVHAHAAFLL